MLPLSFARATLLDGKPKLRTVDLFAGAGGFSLGLEMAGFRSNAAVELDGWACDTLEANLPHTTVVRSDIRNLSADELAGFGTEPDLLVGGPPCQGFSVANNAAGDPKDPRNSLFKEFVRAARILRPRALLMENVPGLLRRRIADRTPVIDVIRAEFRAAGYHPHVAVLQAVDYGVPQLRPRLFVLGLRRQVQQPFPHPTHSNVSGGQSELPGLGKGGLLPARTLWEAIGDLPSLEANQGAQSMGYPDLETGSLTNLQKLLRADAEQLHNHKAMAHSRRIVQRFASLRWGESGADAPPELRARRRSGNGELSGKDYSQNNRRMHPHRPCHTLPASFYANFVHPFDDRNFTPREGARIQTFPDWYRFLGKPTVVSRELLKREGRDGEMYLCQYNQIGNAVPPLLACVLGRHISGLLGEKGES